MRKATAIQPTHIMYVSKTNKKEIHLFVKMPNIINKDNIHSLLEKESKFSHLQYYKDFRDEYEYLNSKTKQIEKLDSVLSKYNSSGIIQITERNNESYPNNISKYLKPLEDYYNWPTTISNIWFDIMQVGRELPKLDEKDYNCNFLYGANVNFCPDSIRYMKPYLNSFRDKNPNYNFHFLLELNNLDKYRITDYSYTNSKLLEKRAYYVSDTLSIYRDTVTKYHQLEKDIRLQQIIDKEGTFHTLIPRTYDFASIYHDEFEIRSLESMNNTINEMNVDQGIEWLIKDGNIFSQNIIWKKIQEDERVKDCGHTGNTMAWTVLTLKQMYKIGWENFAVQVLCSRGLKVR